MLSSVRVFPPFFPTENMWHQSFLLARFSRFNPSCECRKEKKKDGSVSKEAHSSWGSLITVVVERETEDERHERWSAADMAGISRQRWDESTYSGYALLLIWGCDITSCSTPKGSESVKQESQSKWRGSEGIVLWPTNVRIGHQNAAPGTQFPEALNTSWRQLNYGSGKCSDFSGKVSLSGPDVAQVQTQNPRLFKYNWRNLRLHPSLLWIPEEPVKWELCWRPTHTVYMNMAHIAPSNQPAVTCCEHPPCTYCYVDTATSTEPYLLLLNESFVFIALQGTYHTLDETWWGFRKILQIHKTNKSRNAESSTDRSISCL